MDYNPQALPAGTVVAGFRIERMLGSGGFGITYEAVSTVTKRRVAIKEFFPRGIASRESATKLVYSTSDTEVVTWALDRFERSTSDLCELKHPNIVEVIHYVKENDTGYMIMEYVDGLTLEAWLRQRRTPPSPAELKPVLEPVIDALAYVHGCGRIHRDVAPDNIMIRPDGRPVLIDFGAVKLIEQRTRTVQTFLVAKANYSPPEQTQQGVDLDRSADIYALGAVLYRSYSSGPPVDAETRIKGVAFGHGDPYVPLANAAAVVLPAGTAATIDRALAFRAKDRIQSVEELRAGLEWGPAWTGLKAVEGATTTLGKRAEPVQVTPLAPLPPLPAREPTPPPKPPPFPPRIRIAAVAGAIALVAAVAIGLADPFGWFGKLVDRCASRNELDRVTILGETALEDFTTACRAGPLAAEAQQRLDGFIDTREKRALDEAGNDVGRINAYLATCRRCVDRQRAEARLALAAQEERSYRDAAGDAVRLQAYVDRCQVCQFKDDARRAIDTLKTVSTDKRPGDATAAYNRGKAHREKGEYDLAIRDYDEAIRLNPSYAVAFNDRGVTRWNKSEYDRAIADYNEAIRIDPKYALAVKNRGTAYADKHEYDRAIADFNEAIRLVPTYADAFRARGTAYWFKHDNDRAITDHTEAIRLDSSDSLAYNERGNAYLSKLDNDRALQDYNQAIKLNAKDPVYFYNRGVAYSNKGDFDHAINDYTEAITLNPKYFGALNRRGNAYFDKRNFDRAIADYNEAIRLNSTDPVYFYNRGVTYSNKHEFDRAIVDLNEAIRLRPDYSDAFNSRGNAYFDKKDYDRALQDYNEAIRINASDPVYFYNRGLTYANKHDYDRAIVDFSAAIKLKPAYPDAFNSRANAYFDKRDFDRAVIDYNEAIRLNPSNPVYFQNRAGAYRNKGDNPRAIADFRKALTLNPPDTTRREVETALRELGVRI